MMILSRRSAVPAYLLLVAGVLGTGLFAVRSAQYRHAPELLALAVALDVTVLLPGAYFLLARKMRWPLITTVPVFVAALVVVNLILPAGHDGLLTALEVAGLPLELAALAYLFGRARSVAREYRSRDAGAGGFVEAMAAAVEPMAGRGRAASILTTEAATLYYGFLAWRRAPAAAGDTTGSFSYHVTNAYTAVIMVFTFLILVETAVVHILLSLWSPAAAWVLSGLGIYGLLFLLADFNAARHRPVLVGDGFLDLRIGLRWRARIPVGAVESVERIHEDPRRSATHLRATLFGGPNLLVRLRNLRTVTGIYGIRRKAETISLFLDDPEGFRSHFPPDKEG